MATINSSWVQDYFKKRPQLKRPHFGILGYEISPEWEPVVTKLLSLINKPIKEKRTHKKITSNARWTLIGNTDDRHDTVGQAQAVCKMLKKEYSKEHPCKVRGECIEAWVEVDGIKQ